MEDHVGTRKWRWAVGMFPLLIIIQTPPSTNCSCHSTVTVAPTSILRFLHLILSFTLSEPSATGLSGSQSNSTLKVCFFGWTFHLNPNENGKGKAFKKGVPSKRMSVWVKKPSRFCWHTHPLNSATVKSALLVDDSPWYPLLPFLRTLSVRHLPDSDKWHLRGSRLTLPPTWPLLLLVSLFELAMRRFSYTLSTTCAQQHWTRWRSSVHA